MNDKGWISIYQEQPKQGQECSSKISGQKGYVSLCIFNNGYFETYNNESNRFVITRWKHNVWKPIN